VSRNSAIAAAAVAGAAALVIGYYVGSSRSRQTGEPAQSDIAEQGGPDTYRVPIGDGPTKGPADALVTIVEWSDFECPHCSKAAKTLGQLSKRFDGKIRVAFRHNPLPMHRNAMAAAEASLAAHEQGRFWEYHDLLFANQEQLAERGPALLTELAKRLDLDMDRFGKALEEHRFRERVEQDKQLLRDLGQGGTPMFFVNGRLLRGAQKLDAFERVVEEEEARAKRLLDSGTERIALYEALTRDGIRPRQREQASAPQGMEGPSEPVNLPRNGAGPGMGPADAPVHVVEFFDFQCPACSQVPAELHKLAEAFPSQVRVEFRQFPLPFHSCAATLSEIALAAHAQGKYVELGDLFFENQFRFRGLDPEQGRSVGLELAAKVEGLDMARLRKELERGGQAEMVDRDIELGKSIPIKGTPTVYVNGVEARGRSFAALKAQVEEILDSLPAKAPPAEQPAAEPGPTKAKAAPRKGVGPAKAPPAAAGAEAAPGSPGSP
jgi:protein-disulfide isomerase